MSVQLDWVDSPLPAAKPRRPRAHWEDRRDLGMLRAETKAQRECGEEWTSDAATYLYHYAAHVAKGQPFLIEDARELAHQAPYTLGKPTNPKAWGPAVKRASKKGWIKTAGFAAVRCSNGSPRALWVLA